MLLLLLPGTMICSAPGTPRRLHDGRLKLLWRRQVLHAYIRIPIDQCDSMWHLSIP
jgi:hypothetical protein